MKYFFVANEIIATKLCMWQYGQLPQNNCALQKGLVQQNNIHGSNA
jgi:hypothetical protein